MKNIAPATKRLREFLKSWNPKDVIDENSGLTAADLGEVLADLEGRYEANRHGDEDWDSPASS